jgi:hypothetical protein
MDVFMICILLVEVLSRVLNIEHTWLRRLAFYVSNLLVFINDRQIQVLGPCFAIVRFFSQKLPHRYIHKPLKPLSWLILLSRQKIGMDIHSGGPRYIPEV